MRLTRPPTEHLGWKRARSGILGALWAIALLPLAAVSQTSKPRAKQPSNSDAVFTAFGDRFFDGYFHFRSGRATHTGLHQYDAELPLYSRREITAEIARSKRALAELDRIPRAGLSHDNQFDARLLESGIRAHLLDLEDVRMWEKNPDFYNGIVSGSLFVLIQRDFAPLDQRLRSLVSRERQVPGVLASARENVRNPPAVYTQIAIQQAGAEIDFLQNQLPQAVAGAQDESLKAEFGRVNQQAIDAYRVFLDSLKTNLQTRSPGSFPIGREIYSKKLLYDEMVDMPLEALLKLGERELRRTQGDFKATAELIDKTKPPAAILSELSADHPDAANLIPSTQAVLTGLRRFLTTHPIVTLLASQDPKVVPTPPFMRALTFASMDSPGPFERLGSAFYNLTLPEADWSPGKSEEYLRGFNRYALEITSIHEVYPGHYTQSLREKRLTSKVRRLASTLHQPWGEIGSNGEGWAHYSEQMMLEEGYGEGDPKLLLFQLQDALLRLCRYIVGIRMHTQGMTLEQAADFFEREGYLEPVAAQREALRGTADPTYLVYTLGKLEILKLREDVRKKEGGRFNLKDFHDRFLSYGNVPVKLIREEMLGDDSPAL